MPEPRPTARRFMSGARQRERLIRQAIWARRAVDPGQRSKSTETGDPAEPALVERAKQWVHRDPPHDTIPGAS